MPIPAHIDPTDEAAMADWMASDDFNPDPGDWSYVGDVVARIKAADEAVERARGLLDDEVRAAHDAGASWTVIGAALGISRQAARQRFASPART